MSKLRVKAKLGDQTRAVEWDRQRPLEFAQFKTVLENRFGYRGANLKYRKADGSLQPIYQDFHLEEAAKDASKAGKLFLTIELDGGIAGGPVTNSTTSPYTPPVQSSTPTPAPVQQQQQQSAPVQSSTPTRGQSNTISSSSNNSRVPAARTNSASRVSEAPVSLQRTGSNTKNNTTASSPSVDKQRRATVAEPPGSDTWSSALGGRTCPECNAPLSPKAKFCPSCGAKTPVGTTGVPAKKQDSSPPATQQQQSQPKAADDEHCAACGLELSGQVAKALDKLWHRDCFTCVTCHKSLISTSFVPDDRGRPMCSDCYETRNLKKCSKCGQAIKSAYMEAGNSTYHKKCFVCSSCNKDLSVGGEYWLKDGSLLCGDHV